MLKKTSQKKIISAGLLNLTGLVIPWWAWLAAGLAIAVLVGWYWLNRAKVKSWLEREMLAMEGPEIKPALATKAIPVKRSE